MFYITVAVKSDDAAREFIRAQSGYQYISHSSGWHPLINVPVEVAAWTEIADTPVDAHNEALEELLTNTGESGE